MVVLLMVYAFIKEKTLFGLIVYVALGSELRARTHVLQHVSVLMLSSMNSVVALVSAVVWVVWIVRSHGIKQWIEIEVQMLRENINDYCALFERRTETAKIPGYCSEWLSILYSRIVRHAGKMTFIRIDGKNVDVQDVSRRYGEESYIPQVFPLKRNVRNMRSRILYPREYDVYKTHLMNITTQSLKAIYNSSVTVAGRDEWD